MAWLFLFIAGFFEIIWAVGMKYTDGFSKIVPTAAVFVAMLLSVYFLSIAVKTIPVGTAYAVWTGIGIVGTTIWGIAVFDEPFGFFRVFFISLIIISIVGLRLIAKPI
ncbi:MAG: multidrug efflux SMR transporter [Bacteroidales bacterium]